MDVELFFKKITRIFNPDELMIKLFNMSILKEPAEQPGLVMIQVDGLSYRQLQAALANRKMPHLKKLLDSENYSCRPLYSGLPSSTASVQGELFYGVKLSVPGFSYRDSKTGKAWNMLNPGAALTVEERLKTQGEPLLSGGSAHGDIFTGGAAEAHYCVAGPGWERILRPYSTAAFIMGNLLHLDIFIRLVAGIIVEFFSAVYDFFRAVLAGKDATNTVRFSIVRAMVCVLLRDFVAMGAKIDIKRGLPIIHLDLVGYDEQAHYAGPSSARAHRYLPGIDRCIGRLIRAARHSRFRDYEIFVYSDHGQEETVFYTDETGKKLQDAINEVFENTLLAKNWKASLKTTPRHWRAGLLKKKGPKQQAEQAAVAEPGKVHVEVEAIGPVGHIYPPVRLSGADKEHLAQQLVAHAGIPSVLYIDGSGSAAMWGASGKSLLPEDAGALIDARHPFFDRIASDLVDLCRHPDSGALILIGWRRSGKTVTFFSEAGSHAGPGHDETEAFALLPAGALPRPPGQAMDIQDLREAAMRATGRLNFQKISTDPGTEKKPAGAIRVMSYNVHGCKGRDGRISPERIARVIASHSPDIVALQELKANDAAHQGQIISEKLSMKYHYHSPVMLKTGWHGNAVLSTFDVRLVHSGALPRLLNTPLLEPRGALWVEVDIGGKKLQVITTHLSLFPRENYMQAKAIIGREWAGNTGIKGPVIICGDFNATYRNKTYRLIAKAFKSAFHGHSEREPAKTFPSNYPVARIDHLFTDLSTKTHSVSAPASRFEKKASDHLPLIVDVFI